jgi:FkbM family methyltransferase
MRAGLKAQLRRMPTIYAMALVAVKALDIRRGRWTEPELRLIAHLVRPGESAVDVGANYGLWSYHLARAVGEAGTVVAFEPVPQTFKALRRVLWLLGAGRVRTINAGIGERDERVAFAVPVATESGTTVGGLAHMVGAEGARDDVVVEADIKRLDAVGITGDVALVKVDVEGAELYALRGASALIREHQPIVICEIGQGLSEPRYGLDGSEVEDLLAGWGYETFKLAGGRLTRASIDGDSDGNYVFVPAARRGRLAALMSGSSVAV